MITVTVDKKLSHREWQEMQCWVADNFPSYVDSYVELYPNNTHAFDFFFTDEGEAAWFKLKWTV